MEVYCRQLFCPRPVINHLLIFNYSRYLVLLQEAYRRHWVTQLAICNPFQRPEAFVRCWTRAMCQPRPGQSNMKSVLSNKIFGRISLVLADNYLARILMASLKTAQHSPPSVLCPAHNSRHCPVSCCSCTAEQ